MSDTGAATGTAGMVVEVEWGLGWLMLVFLMSECQPPTTRETRMHTHRWITRWRRMTAVSTLALLLLMMQLLVVPSLAFLGSLLDTASEMEEVGAAVVRTREEPTPARASMELESLAELHASLKKLVARREFVPSRCRAVAAESTVAHRCAQLTSEDKTYLAVAFTECHFELYTHKYRGMKDETSCQSLAPNSRQLADCIKDLNSEPGVFPIFTQFKNNLEQLCQEVDHGFQHRRAHEAMDSILGATLETARSLGQLQEGTEQLGREIAFKMDARSSAVLDLLASHTSAEAKRFEALSTATAKLEAGQGEMVDELRLQTTQLRDLLSDAQGIQKMINAASQDIESTQKEILVLQSSTHDQLGETRNELVQLKTSQKESFTSALNSLTTLRDLSDRLSEAQSQNTELVANLAVDQEAAFKAAAKDLGMLQEEQRKSFRLSEEQMRAVQATQAELHTSQNSLLSSMKLSGEALADLARTQVESFKHTGTSLDRIQQQAAEVESRLGTMLGELKHMATQLLNINMDVLAELFQIHSALFYVALVPIAYLATATERTKAARFWIFLLLLSTLLLELNLVTAAHRFRLQLSQAEFDGLRTRLRYALSVLSCCVILLTALLHRDLVSLSHALHERNARVLGNNHRMLHEILRRTEHLSPPTSPEKQEREADDVKTYEPRNPFQQPPLNSVLSPRNQQRVNPLEEGRSSDSSMPSLDKWKQTAIDGPDACCADQRPASGLSRLFSFTRPSSAEVKLESEPSQSTTGSTRERAKSPRVTSNSRASPRSAKLLEPEDEQEEGVEPQETNEDEEEEAEIPRARTPRATRSRSRAPEVPPTAAAAAASSKHHHRTQSAKTPIKEESPADDEETLEEDQPGEKLSSRKKKKHVRASV